MAVGTAWPTIRHRRCEALCAQERFRFFLQDLKMPNPKDDPKSPEWSCRPKLIALVSLLKPPWGRTRRMPRRFALVVGGRSERPSRRFSGHARKSRTARRTTSVLEAARGRWRSQYGCADFAERRRPTPSAIACDSRISREEISATTTDAAGFARTGRM